VSYKYYCNSEVGEKYRLEIHKLDKKVLYIKNFQRNKKLSKNQPLQKLFIFLLKRIKKVCSLEIKS
jgi:hypothetical protein